jgi:hypothetical protein
MRSKITIVVEHVEFRPEFKKDANPAAEGAAVSGIPYDDEDENALAMAEKELEAVTF